MLMLLRSFGPQYYQGPYTLVQGLWYYNYYIADSGVILLVGVAVVAWGVDRGTHGQHCPWVVQAVLPGSSVCWFISFVQSFAVTWVHIRAADCVDNESVLLSCAPVKLHGRSLARLCRRFCCHLCSWLVGCVDRV